MSRLQILLHVASRSESGGALVRDLVKESGINQSSVARALSMLGAAQMDGLIEQVPDPEDPRRVRVHLTRRGESFLSGVSNVMG
ncbi:winged helix DNA-binding protein [Oceanicola sp. 22II-s10i]|uniref:winged helix DNA-binding protein n=1 Tax=Oceanicola sp. 22II-s10i TaxID=1317116 RepID=UPI001595AAE7|nr:winged helix DNA-binding protein [Oceanicola sp. 22II-s10i]